MPENQPKHPRNGCFFGRFGCLVFGCFSAVGFRLFFSAVFTDTSARTRSAPFSAVFQLFSMSGIWHLCRWPQRLQVWTNGPESSSKVSPHPRDPPVLKILRRVNFGTGTKFGTDVAKRYGEGSEMLVFFSGKLRQENRTESEKLRR